LTGRQSGPALSRRVASRESTHCLAAVGLGHRPRLQTNREPHLADVLSQRAPHPRREGPLTTSVVGHATCRRQPPPARVGNVLRRADRRRRGRGLRPSPCCWATVWTTRPCPMAP